MRIIAVLLLLLLVGPAFGQQLALDYGPTGQKEGRIKVKLFKYFIGGANTLGHVDISSEVLNIHYGASGGFASGISVVGTTALLIGNKNDIKNNLSYLLNPLAGVNGSLYFFVPLQKKELSSVRLGGRFGLKWIEGTPLRGYENRFLSGYGMLGGVYQRQLYENAPENQWIDFWAFPHLMASQLNTEDLSVFFDNQLETISFGYGLQTGVEFNRKVRLIFLLNQLVNTNNPDTLGNIVLRLTLSYRF